ncbi:Uncharacterised protein [Rodentibacter pneumotropicus]|uniref:Uncharacterized protein n=1 Tax=Rodentibacter pneumotropicus TaxID=758 RepID=A0A448MM23_9PAST|nr:Uncharacterised protein [Rodentibacter pneumotropicus]
MPVQNHLRNQLNPKYRLLVKVPIFAKRHNKNNVRHKTKVAKHGLSGITTIKVMRPKGQRMARVGENTKDRRDPFYWWMVEYGTVKMKGRYYMEKGAQTGRTEALRITEETFKKNSKKECLNEQKPVITTGFLLTEQEI